jgi:multidrug efflux pump subunit AcrA (membrane-fusion protein)
MTDGTVTRWAQGAIRADIWMWTFVGPCAVGASDPSNRSTQMMSFMPTLMPTLRTARLLTILLLPALAACGQGQSQPQASPPPPPQVTIAKPVSKMVADQDEYVGRFVAVESVEVRARVPGYLEAIHFQDGQMVKEGDLLFTIDRRPFQIALAQTQASLARARATLAFAESDLARAQGLALGTVITQQKLTQAPVRYVRLLRKRAVPLWNS